MPVPIPGSKVGSGKVKFLTISGRPKTRFFGYISGVPGYIPPIPASYQPRSLVYLVFLVFSSGFICVSSALLRASVRSRFARD